MTRRHWTLCALALAAMCAGGWPAATRAEAQAGQQAGPEPNRGGALDLASTDPRVALERLRVAAGYEVSLFASEQQFPELANPLAMTFDARGRLWVLTAPTYPHYLPGTPPHDKLVILEDANGDGRADRLKVFADGLYIPTGFELGDGGAYVAQQPNLVFLRDTNGDDRADERRVILHGFGTEDSHHSIHAFTWDPGGGLHFQEGTFLHSQVETPYGPVRLEESGVWRYEPRTEKLSVFVSYNFANPWGHVIDRWGQNFISDASNGDNYYGTAFSGHVPYPRKQPSMRTWVPTTMRPTCGIELVTSRHFPESAQGNFLLTNVIGFLGIKQFKPRDDGSGFAGDELEPLLHSADPNFRPVALQFGPDGALYVVDWFNPLIGHMQYSLRDSRRDTTHGRVWRITAKGRPLNTPPRIAGQTIAAQLDLLKAYEDRTRYRARRALREWPTADVAAALKTWIGALDPADPGYEHHLLEALWVHQHHDAVEPALLKRLLSAKDFKARAAAVRVLQHWYGRVEGSAALLRAAVRDEAPRVRLEAVRAASFVPAAESAEIALEALRLPMDYWLRYVLESTMTTLEPVWKPALVTRGFAADNPAGVAFLLDRLTSNELAALPPGAPVLDALLTRSGIERQHRQQAIEALARANGTTAVRELMAALERVDGVPGRTPAARDLGALLVTSPRDELVRVTNELERLASPGRTASDVIRQSALAAIVRATGDAARAATLTEASAQARIDLANATALVEDTALLDALYPTVSRVVRAADGPPSGLASSSDPSAVAAGRGTLEPPRTGRYIRIVLPGRDRTLRLREVQVFSRGENVALRGAATQSSIGAGATAGGNATRAIDGKLEGEGAAAAVTTSERDPWWELDLGAPVPIDTIAIWNAPGPGRTDGFHVSVLGPERRPVFAQEGIPTATPTEVVTIGGNLTQRLVLASIQAMPRMRGHEAEAFELLSRLVRSGSTRYAAIDAIRQLPEASWPPTGVSALGDDLVAYLRGVAPGNRTGAAFRQAVDFGRHLAARLPTSDGQRLSASLDQLVVRTIRIEAVRAQMKFDVSRITLQAGEDVEIEFVNADEMPHNLLITSPGAMETVALKAEAMVQDPAAFSKHFVPESKDVLFWTPLVAPGETIRRRFTAPARPDGYPFVCTFPGHWRTMNGTVEVTRAVPAPSAP